jgi:hypothetical protein
MTIDPAKIKPFMTNGSVKKEITPQDLHFLWGYKPNTLMGYKAAVKKFLRYMEQNEVKIFALPIIAANVYGFCYWARRNKGKSIKQEISSKTLEKYLHGIKAWHLYHSAKYPKSVKARVKVLLCSSARDEAQEPPREKKKAVHLKHLLHLAETLGTWGPKDRAVFDLAIVAFWGMARLGELTSPSATGEVDPRTSILKSDISWEQLNRKTGAVITLRDAKTVRLRDAKD